MGYGLILSLGKSMELIHFDVVISNKQDSHFTKLQHIYNETCLLIGKYKPDQLAIEAPFYGKNVQSMLKLGRAQGVAIAAGLSHNLPIFEYSPKKVKQSITGKGNASKEQVAAMLQRLLKFGSIPKHLDATDGLSVAVCHHFQNDIIGSNNKKYSNWEAFVKDNPGRSSK